MPRIASIFVSLAFAVCAANALAQIAQAEPKKPTQGHIVTPSPTVNTKEVKIPDKLDLPGPDQVEVGSQPLPIAEAIAIAMRRQPLVIIAKSNLLSAQGVTQQANSALQPQFTATAGYNDQRSVWNGLDPASSPATAVVGVQQLLYDFGRTRDLVRQQSALERGVRYALVRTRQSVALQVKLAFYDLIQSLANITSSESDMSNRESGEFDQAQARMQSGLGAPIDVVQAKTNLADAAISLASSREAALVARLALAKVLGIDPRTPITPVPTTEAAVVDEGDLRKLVEISLVTRPDIKAADQQLRAAGFASKVARKSSLPQVSALAGLNGAGAPDPFSTQTASFGVNLSWTFGDGGLTAGKIKEAKGNAEVAVQTLIDAKNQVIGEVGQYYVALKSALQRVSLAQTEVENAVELVRISEGRYIGGLGQFLDVTTAQNSLFSSNQRLTQAQEDVDRARAKLRTAIGFD